VPNEYWSEQAGRAFRLRRRWESTSEAEVRPAFTGGGSPGSGGTRQAMTAYTSKTRNALRWRLATLPWSELGPRPAMVTLTMPRDWRAVAPDGPTTYGLFEAYQMRWQRRWGERMRGVWIREFQERGAPHYHCYVGLPVKVSDEEYAELVDRTMLRKKLEREVGKRESKDKLPFMKGPFGGWARECWYDVVGSGDEWHKRKGADVAPMFWGVTVRDAQQGRVDFGKVSEYLYSESGKWGQKKVPDGFTDPGRWWGVLGRLKPRITENDLPEPVAMELRRMMCGLHRTRQASERGMAKRSVRKPYRGRDGFTLYDIGREEYRSLVLLAMDLAELKAAED
jgi:hypothetical protein